ncbi:hypothetical protein A2Z67_00675 [Candidatus Woesebacteria bacterium RBG_13_36_22]|nr:MAG: hypothetical protein A2Z67_00675 [Candidatus Woesebacteria bacterium RBG_13_36_22]
MINTEIEKHLRVDAMLEALNKGIKSSDDLLAAADAAQARFTNRKGWRSEQRFCDYIQTIHTVDGIIPSSNKAQGKGIDFWLKFKENYGLPKIPVQIKSSAEAVNAFKQCQKYIDLKKAIIVLNVSRYISKGKFRREFSEEFDRVLFLIREDSAIYTKLTNLFQSSNN